MRWSYKTILYELKKEGILGNSFLDEPEIELSLNQYGKAGWELVSLLETMDGVIAVFKQPLDLDTRAFTAPSVSSERIDRSQEDSREKTKSLEPGREEKKDLEIFDEDVAEAMLLDEYEVVENKVEETDDKSSASPVDVGLIRIE
jgi:hypothetical protein